MRRQILARLNGLVQKAADLEELGGARVIEDAFKLLSEEFGGAPPAKALLCFSGFWLAVASGLPDEAERFGSLAARNAEIAEGPDSWRAQSLRELVATARQRCLQALEEQAGDGADADVESGDEQGQEEDKKSFAKSPFPSSAGFADEELSIFSDL
mmetsp:Transcript_20619/g.52452  ORF Transcript_20619/g.52452 Transcript_20619/m.52452 type:complete len:156 (+) Transcript_20619:1-468(+)